MKSQVVKSIVAQDLALNLVFLLFEEHCEKKLYPRKYYINKIEEWQKKATENQILETNYPEHNIEILEAIKEITNELLAFKNNLSKGGLICSHCGERDITVTRDMFDGMCADCTDKSLYDDGKISKNAQIKNEELKRDGK